MNQYYILNRLCTPGLCTPGHFCSLFAIIYASFRSNICPLHHFLEKNTFFLQQANITLNIFENSAILLIFFLKNEEFASKLRFNAYQYISNCVYYLYQSHMIE